MPNSVLRSVYSMIAVALAGHVAKEIDAHQYQPMSVEKMKEIILPIWKKSLLGGIGAGWTLSECYGVASTLVRNSKLVCTGDFDGDIKVLLALLYHLGLGPIAFRSSDQKLSVLAAYLRSNENTRLNDESVSEIKKVLPPELSAKFYHWSDFYLNALYQLCLSEH